MSLPRAYAGLAYANSLGPRRSGAPLPPPPADAVGEASSFISAPRLVERRVHVEIDPETGHLRGMPTDFGGGGSGGAAASAGSAVAAARGVSGSDAIAIAMAAFEAAAASEAAGNAAAAALVAGEVSASSVAGSSAPSSFFGTLFRRRRVPPLTSAAPPADDDAGASDVSVSAPFNVEHKYHVSTSLDSATGFSGMPPEWTALLAASGITSAEVRANPQAVLEVLQFTVDGPAQPTVRRPRPQVSVERAHGAALASHLRDDVDPNSLYETRGGKLGEGVSGVVHLGIEKSSGRKVAIKIAPAADVVNLKNETALLALSQHPDIGAL
jgi:hypothetical protein